MIAPPCSARCSGSPTSSKAIKANGRERCGQQRGSKRSRRTRRHTRGQIDPIQQLVVEPRQWYVNYAKTDGCKRALNWRPTLPLQRRHKCGQRRRVTAPVIRMRASAANSIWIVPLVPEGAVNGCRSGAMETAAKRTPSSCRCTGSDPQARTPARRTGLCLIRLDKPAFPSQTAPREQLARGQPVSPRRHRHKPGPAIALRHDPVLLFQRPTAPGARRDNVKPRGLRNRRMPSRTPMSSPPQHIRQGGLRRKNMSKSDICAIKWSPFRGAPKRRIARS